jgi:D-sedoheptulose 7-phosphate isomerase
MGTVVFTNGCFDLLHPGHIHLLKSARDLGDKLIVGINSDRSVRAIKGPGRPFQNEADRKSILESLRFVDEVVIYDENTPANLIKDIKPDVIVKGGDWKPEEIIGSDTVIRNGGKVVSIPLIDGHSTTGIASKVNVLDDANEANRKNEQTLDVFAEHAAVFEALRQNHLPAIERCAAVIRDTFGDGKKVLLCGNGGSAADAQHIAAEFVGRYEKERRAFPAIALTTDTSALTALANDYDFERIFARQVEALAQDGDCLVAISTSGNSPNVIAGVMTARRLGCKVVGMTGAGD